MWASRWLRLGTLVLALAFVAVPPAFAQQVTVIGNQRIEADTVRSYLNLRPGVPFDAARQDEAVKALFATGLFSDVRITRDGGRIIVRVVENPVLNRVVFEGNRRVDTATLRAEVESRSRGIYSQTRVQSDVQRILDLYRRQGRFDVRVEPRVVELPQGRLDLIFQINEGQRTSIGRIAFVGNRVFSDMRLRDVITTKETNWLSWLSTRDVYDPDRLNVDQELLRRFYLRNGYADFRVVSAVADFDQGRNAFTITITVEEGEQYRFGAIEVESNVAAIDAATLRPFVRTSPGSVYNAELVDRTIEDMSLEVAGRGYPFAQVRPRGDRDPVNRVVNITYVLDEAPRLYVERINIRGNTRTMDRVIRREFDLVEGDALNRVLVDRAERRLNQLGYFRNVRITREPGTGPDRVVLNVNVEEQSTGDISFGIGYASNEGVIADVSITERNFLGRGQIVRAAVGWGERRRSFDFSFTEPYFLDRRLAAGFDIFYRETRQSRTQSFDQRIFGGGVRLGVALNEHLSSQVRYRLYEQRINIPNEFWDCAPAKPGTTANLGFGNLIVGIPDCVANGEASQALKSAQGSALVSMAGASLILNRLDNPRQPRNGLYAELAVDIAGLGGDVNFIRTTGDIRAYYNFVDDLVGFVRLQGGHIVGWGGRDVRLVDSFFRGPDLVRGFASSGIGPRDISTSRLDALGGTIYLGATAELQFPVPFIPEELGLRAALFADAGTLFNVGNLGAGNLFVRCTSRNVPAGCNYTDDPWSIRSSVGVSLLWQSPLGPLRFDFAHALSKEYYDRTQFFRFSGGTSF
jgi:outer membrane protein insertion porin family